MENLVDFLDECYDIGGLTDKPRRISQGLVNELYEVVAEDGKYVLRIANAERPLEHIRYELEVINCAIEKDFPAPKVVVSKSGEEIASYEGRHCVLSEFCEGAEYEKGNVKMYEGVARMLAKYHKLIDGFSPAAKKNWGLASDLWWAKHVLKEHAELVNESLGHCLDELLFRAERVEKEIDRSLPTLIVHGDFHASNMKFKGDDVCAVFDWDNVQRNYRAHDIVMSVANIARQEEGEFVSKKMLDVYLAAYQCVLPLDAKELAAIPQLLDSKCVSTVAWAMREYGKTTNERFLDVAAYYTDQLLFGSIK